MPRRVPAAGLRHGRHVGRGALLLLGLTPAFPLKMLITESTLICINYANQVAIAHCWGLGGSRAVLTTSRWTDTGFIRYNKWFCCGVFGKQLVVVIGCR